MLRHTEEYKNIESVCDNIETTLTNLAGEILRNKKKTTKILFRLRLPEIDKTQKGISRQEQRHEN